MWVVNSYPIVKLKKNCVQCPLGSSFVHLDQLHNPLPYWTDFKQRVEQSVFNLGRIIGYFPYSATAYSDMWPVYNNHAQATIFVEVKRLTWTIQLIHASACSFAWLLTVLTWKSPVLLTYPCLRYWSLRSNSSVVCIWCSGYQHKHRTPLTCSQISFL